MIKGPIVTAVVAAAAMAGVVAAFMSNASPYVTIAQAKAAKGDRMHLAGDIVPNTVHTDIASHTLSFELKDQNGDKVEVVHQGEIPQNMADATKVVAVGSMEGTRFASKKLLVKCPSKYEGKEAVAKS